jgi:hypothetical protein
MTIRCLSGDSKGLPVMPTTSPAKSARNLVYISSKEMVRYWRLKKSKTEIEAAIAKVGNNAETVIKELGAKA